MNETCYNYGRDWAIAAHAATNHLYDGYLPYEFHLRLAAKVARDFLHLLTRGAYETQYVMGAVWSHDVIEDARMSYNDVKNEIGWEAADIVYAVTNEKGKNRAERANPLYYQGIVATPYATFVKLSDRTANAMYGKMFGSRMHTMYAREQRHFEHSLRGAELDALRPMVRNLREILNLPLTD